MSLALLVVLGATMASSGTASAFGRAAPDYSDGYVTAHSRIGNGSLTTAVRPAAHGGWEYQNPGGGWYSCEGDCERTITNKVLDFWDNNANRTYPGRGITIGVPY
ncbi:MAG: hypothetical protein ACR2O4_03635 [Hyphomicrobiaceae bacterium]